MQMEKQQLLTLRHLSEHELKRKLSRLNSAYHITDDRHIRMNMLLLMDNIKVELNKRGINDKSI